jgi:hypothetical protein
VIRHSFVIMLRSNKCQKVRQLYDKHLQGNFVVPENIGNLLGAMIRATKGYEWCWKPDLVFVDVPDLSTEDESRVSHIG